MKLEKGTLLLAMPSLKDSIFGHSVVLLAETGESGALGFMVNIPTHTGLHAALRMMNAVEPYPDDLPVVFGGPVQTDFFWMMHQNKILYPSTMKMRGGVHLTSSLEIITGFGERTDPGLIAVGVGYAGWAPDQLEREIEEGSWWMTDFDLSLLFSMSLEERWAGVFQELGVDPDHFVDETDPDGPVIN